MRTLQQIGERLEYLVSGSAQPEDAAELLQLGEETLQQWVLARGLNPIYSKREGFRLLALHHQGAQGEPGFNACRETCRELVYHYNLLKLRPDGADAQKNAAMMVLVVNHLFLFISGKMQIQQLGEFCCSSRPLRAEA